MRLGMWYRHASTGRWHAAGLRLDGMTRCGLTEMTTEERTPEQVATEREQDVCGRCGSFAGLPR